MNLNIGKRKNKTKNILAAFLIKLISPVSVLMAASAVTFVVDGLHFDAVRLPSPESVMAGYMENPYIRFYEGSRGIAWTTVHPEGCELSSYGTYISTDGSVYRAAEGTTVIPRGVIGRKEIQGELKPGQHYYSKPITDSVVPVGRWVLSHREARCIHGPFEACREYEYYGINELPNTKCLSEYDSGWIAYCADCGQPLTGYVYTNDTCVANIGYLFSGSGDFAKIYPTQYIFFCPKRGDNLENDRPLDVHICKCFVSYNRYTVRYNGNGALSGTMPDSVFYYGGSSEYEGNPVRSEDNLRENCFFNPGYVFAGWSITPDGEKVLDDLSTREMIEDSFGSLGGTGDESNDSVITLYAVWMKCDSAVLISGGRFRDERGAYDGVYDGEIVRGSNCFDKGYMYETVVDPALLSHPKGYVIELDMMGGPETGPIRTDTVFDGWRYGDLHGSIKDEMSDGRFTYVHSSEEDGSIDEFTAEWANVPVTLPDAVYPGFVFTGWYTAPDLSPEHFAGTCGDLFDTDHDTKLYACFKSLDLEAVPDYMGNPDFGEMRYDGLTRLGIPGFSGYDLFRYYISGPGNEGGWTEAVTENVSGVTEPCVRSFCTEGEVQDYKVTRTGIYTFELWGGAGASFGSYAGENGEYSSCGILLHEGDAVRIYTGKQGITSQSEDGVICPGGEGSYIEINGKKVLSCSGGKGADHELNIEDEFLYSGEVLAYTVEATGDYTLEVWGARGSPNTEGRNVCGNGGYARGDVHLEEGSILYVCVGGMNGYNGGGRGGRDAYGGHGGCGGGATHIAYEDGVLRDLSGCRDSILIVAGGGGGSAGANATSGAGGGLTGGTGISPWPDGESSAGGGSQTSAGTGWRRGAGGFGYGGDGYDWHGVGYPMVTNGGGGGGWYGGGDGAADGKSYGCGGGGGSGYIGGVENGTMATGVCGGNGHATITCIVNIQGGEPSGCDTSFDPGDLLYRDHRLSVHGECIYPDDDGERSGYCIIREPLVRYYGSSDKTVYSPDADAPAVIDTAGLEYDESSGLVRVFWRMPEDVGTEYSYMARAYRASDLAGTEEIYAQTDVRRLCITTGVYGYYYLIDIYKSATSERVKNMGSFILSPWAGISGSSPDAYFTEWYAKSSWENLYSRSESFIPDGSDRYIHIISVDRAGNASEVFSMAVDGPNAYIPYPVVTEKLVIREGDNVFGSGDVYYFRADAETPFYLEHSSYIAGYARQGYQIDKASFYMSMSEYAEYGFPCGDTGISEQTVASDALSRTAAFYPVPSPDCTAVRSDNGRSLSFTGEFVSSFEGEIFIYPGASARLEAGAHTFGEGERMIRSDTEKDRMNGITLIGDATAPMCYVSVNGGNPEDLSVCNVSNVLAEYVIDRRCESVSIELFVRDECSGAKDGFEIRIRNIDNGSEGTFTATGKSFSMELKIDGGSTEPLFENMLFNGDFIISVTSEDNVGNRGIAYSECLHELDVSGRICRCLDELTGPLITPDGDRIIKRGESGYVVSDVWGYPGAVLVSFENEKLSCFDTLYVTDGNEADLPEDIKAVRVRVPFPDYMFEERTEFTVPLDYDSDVIRVRITAYKDGESLTWETECMLGSEGTVLDELVTILR